MYSLDIQLIVLLFASVICADNTFYTIWPRNSNDFATNNGIADDLANEVGVENIYASESASIGYLYWYAPLSEQFKNDFSSREGVLHISEPCRFCDHSDSPGHGSPPRNRNRKKIRALETQKDAPEQLKVVSQAKGQVLKDMDGFTFDDKAGQDTRVYIIDSGLETTSPEFKDLDIAWLWPGPKPEQNEKTESDQWSHGTCMASMVAGVTIGSAKKTKITMARVNLKDEGLRVERYIDGLVMIYDDIYNKVLQGKAVVSISWGFTADYPDDQKYIEAARAAFEYLIKALLDNYNVLTVVSAGQANSDRYDDPIEVYPALSGKEIDLLTVVAAVDNEGNSYQGGRWSDWVKVSGPGDKVRCATKEGYSDIEEGSSPPTATTAGVLAYFLSLGKSPVDARKALYDLAWPRKNGGRAVIYNGANDDAGDAESANPPS